MPAQKPQLPSAIWLIFLGLLVVTLFGVFGSGGGGSGTTVIPYSQFQQ